MFLRVTCKTEYTAYADDVSAYTKISIVPIPTALVIRKWDEVWQLITELKQVMQNDLKDNSRVPPRDTTYITSFTL